MARAGWSPAPPGGIGDWERRLPSPFSLRIALSEDGDPVTWSAMAACPEAHALLEALGADGRAPRRSSLHPDGRVTVAVDDPDDDDLVLRQYGDHWLIDVIQPDPIDPQTFSG
jgi:hypothetical protein